ncbi:hypothetical protein BJ165DRAFT_1348900 [Panaeolus papilionaceus]|nr:hypothetical protein BJ165DRAFT_1348900 [Panaeolus papilionaceus]
MPFEAEALANLKYPFTLAAFNDTLPKSNSTGAPLVLGQAGSTRGLYFYVTSTYASYPYNDYPELALVDGELHAFTRAGQWITNATEVRSGGTLGWTSSTIYTSPAPQIYSAIKNPSYQYPLLAAHGVSTLWSLCTFPNTYPQNNVVFNVSAATPSSPGGQLPFDPNSCYSVLIDILPLSL